MKNKVLILIVLLVGFLISVTLIAVNLNANVTNIYEEQEHVKYDEVLNSSTPTIYYYYQKDCHFCNSIKDQITAFVSVVNETEGIDFKMVDLKDNYNQPAWYDWSTHNQKYTPNDAKSNPNYIYEAQKMKKIDDIKITGTPTMIYVKDKEVQDYEVGGDVFDILEKVNDEFSIGATFDRSRYGQS